MKKTVLAVVTFLCAQWAYATTETTEIITLKLDVAGEMETLDLENFPVGATETIYTESGSQALVTRFDDHFEIEINGEQIVVDLPQIHTLDGSEHHLWAFDDVEIDTDVEKHVFIKSISGDDLDGLELTEILAEHGIDPDEVHEAHEKHVVIKSVSGDTDIDVAELLAEHGIDPSELHEAHDKRVVVIKKRAE